jgi:hypothetical protein
MFNPDVNILIDGGHMNDNRKHHSQMNTDEVRNLMSKVRNTQFEFTPYTQFRMNGRRITEQQVKAMLTYCTVIEAHNNIASEIRVLVRGKVQGDFVCAVVSLTTKKFVTVYRNRNGDHHASLDKSIYKWQANLATI